MIRLFDDYVIVSDGLQFILQIDTHTTTVRKNKDKDGNDTSKEVDVYKTIGYYGTVKAALEGLRRYLALQKIESGKFDSLNEAIAELGKIDRDFHKALSNIKF